VSRSYVSRLLREERRARVEPVVGETLEAVEEFLANRPLTAADMLRAATLRALAVKLDDVTVSDSVGAAQAAPALARQIAETIDAMAGEENLAAATRRSLAWIFEEARDAA
jgi:hypothetical protein